MVGIAVADNTAVEVPFVVAVGTVEDSLPSSADHPSLQRFRWWLLWWSSFVAVAAAACHPSLEQEPLDIVVAPSSSDLVAPDPCFVDTFVASITKAF